MAEGVTFAGGAAWIWCGAARRPYHNVACFRRAFDVAADAGEASLRITAGDRYEVYLNGEWLGFGPARGWPATWAVDEYDVAGKLRPGRNVVAVLAQHVGLGTFQSLHADAGVIADVRWSDFAGDHAIGTDAAWRCRVADAHGWPVPRISCMQGWEEQFDARRDDGGWREAAFDDAAWPAATVARAAGAGAHRAFVSRDLPMLTRDPTPPVRVLAVEAVRPAPYVWSINPRDLLNATDKSANHLHGRLLLTTDLVASVDQPIEFHCPTGRPWTEWKLNGEPLQFDDFALQQTDTGVAHARLRAGRNVLLGRLPEHEHYWWSVLSAWTPTPIATPTWLALGPFGSDADRGAPRDGISQHPVYASSFADGATSDEFDRIWQRGGATAEDLRSTFARPVPADMIAGDDVYARCASERVVLGLTPRVEAPTALLHDNADWTTVHPVGADVRLLLDFGREVVGFHEFELDAPAGTLVDAHNFEFIQPDGRFNLCEGMNNSFRYVCREGVQRYRTLVRRGFRYSWISLRRFDRPVRIRFVRALMSTYPQARQGSFACSDPMLDRIWEAGAHSVACCSEDAYTDCPTYEQTFWVGDARNEALVDLVANGDPRLSARSLRLAAQSLDRSPLVESQVPSAWQNLLPAWSFLWMRWAAEHVELTGDRKLGAEMLEAIDRQVAGLRGLVSERGLLRTAMWNLFDWAAMDTPSGGEVTHVNGLAALGLREAATLARSLGEEARASAWSTFADDLSAAMNAHLWDDEAQAYIDCIRPDDTRSPVFSQQTQTVAYLAGVATGDRAARCDAIMHAAPSGFVTAGSPFFMFFLLEALVREGQFDKMLATIRSYWGAQIEAGATTFWETYTPDRARMTRSHCHGWSAAPTYFLSRHVLGISPATPGYGRVSVEPRLAGLRWARGAVPTPCGVVRCNWSRAANGAFELRLELPDGVDADVVWPTAARPMVLQGAFDGLVARGRVVRLRSEPP